MSATTSRRSGSKKDWGLVIAGILVLLMGIVIMAWPGLSLVTLAIMAGAILIVAGVSNIATFTRMKGIVPGAGWVLANGIGDILLGAIFVIFPVASADMLPWLSGVFLMAYSVYAIVAGIAMKNAFPGWGLVLATGIVGLLCGIMFIVSPASFVIFLGAFLIFRGVTMAIDGIVSPNSLDYM